MIKTKQHRECTILTTTPSFWHLCVFKLQNTMSFVKPTTILTGLEFVSSHQNDISYKVTSARFERTRTKVWYVSGAPRDNDLFGNVRIYGSDGIPVAVLAGYEMGSYFGAYLLAVDLNNDNIDDILVGAPMAADIAISAPYEDDGVGAVYIYRGDKMGINRVYSQRLSPLNFSPSFGNVRSFGQGLSRGVDIDGNGHNAWQIDVAFLSLIRWRINGKVSQQVQSLNETDGLMRFYPSPPVVAAFYRTLRTGSSPLRDRYTKYVPVVSSSSRHR
ncbi:hypothetical protein NQ317_002933 [Molorchus minor]|uniref:Uncharacterized protein n=1 Tax=Molorchus minor TaxID=1323400 RepID=A0ABQ9IRJ8_9CUCU|nr:hypothetical protein NQ317_002933 [Molorchus minor]